MLPTQFRMTRPNLEGITFLAHFQMTITIVTFLCFVHNMIPLLLDALLCGRFNYVYMAHKHIMTLLLFNYNKYDGDMI